MKALGPQTLKGFNSPVPAWLIVGEQENVSRFEASEIRAALRDYDGDLRRVLEALQLPRKTFYDKLKRHGISRAGE